ncbi:10148_t:CDS:2, partial [Acaulospora colombiana]
MPEGQPVSEEHNSTETSSLDNHFSLGLETAQQEITSNFQENTTDCTPQKDVPSIQPSENTTKQNLYNVQIEDAILRETTCEWLPNPESDHLEPVDLPMEEPYIEDAISNDQLSGKAPPIMPEMPQQQAGGASEESSARTIDSEKHRYRKNLNKGLETKHEKYSKSGTKIDRGKFARACIIAGKTALDERDDVEFAISMFEKAISWYPENERLLEEYVDIASEKEVAGRKGNNTTATQEGDPHHCPPA